MISYTSAGQRNGHGYQLDIRANNGSLKTLYIDFLEELARAACRAKYEREHLDRWVLFNAPGHTDHWVQSHLRASSTRDKPLDILTLCSWGSRVSRYWHLRGLGRATGYVRRSGPVPGIRKRRGGRRQTYSRTMGEKRLNCASFADEGEPLVRARRSPNYLPDFWDDRCRASQRCWKEQHRGRKSWDR